LNIAACGWTFKSCFARWALSSGKKETSVPAAGPIAYVMSRFPHLPETFILREMAELERQGWTVALYPLILQNQAVMHAEARAWMPRAQRLPYISGAVLAANGAAALQHPARYAATAARSLWENRTNANQFVRALALWPKAVYAARQMVRAGVRHIHAHYATHPALVAWIVHRLTGIPYSLTAHAHDIFVRKAMLATKLREAAFIVAISNFNREYLAREVGAWVREKTHVIHCGIMSEHYAARPNGLSPSERFEIMTIGSLQPYKGQRHLVEACALLRDRGVPVHCRIIGGGELQAALEGQIAARQLQGVVELLGPRPQDEVAQLLTTAHCYVQPSIITPSGKMEGIPVSLMEALACALPVVASDLSGIPELVRPGETGTLVPPANAAALAEALASVYAAPQAAVRLGEAGRALVHREFELQANVGQLAALLNRALAGS
jgi:colanic acid/amylovoran biosynthesis glycosyltransferase